MTVLFGKRTEELSASFVELKKTNAENPAQEPGDGKPESQRRQTSGIQNSPGLCQHTEPPLSCHCLPCISKDEPALLDRTGFSKVSLRNENANMCRRKKITGAPRGNGEINTEAAIKFKNSRK